MSFDKILTFCRLFFNHALLITYYALLWWKFGELLEEYPEWNKDGTLAVGVMLGFLFFVSQILSAIYVIRADEDNQSLLLRHLPLVTYLSCTIGPYGMFLHHQYKVADTALMDGQNSSQIIKATIPDCMDVSIPNFNYVIFHIGPPLAVLSYIIYPYPKKPDEKQNWFVFLVKFIDSLDLLNFISITRCVQSYSSGWIALFYASLGVSALLLAIPMFINNDDDDNESNASIWARVISSCCSLVFTDVMFGILRILVMFKESNVQIGFDFVLKNFISIAIRLVFIWKTFVKNDEANVTFGR